MSALTSGLLAALLVYLIGWWRDAWVGDLPSLLFVLLLVSFAYWLAEKFYFFPKRRQAFAKLEEDEERRKQELDRLGIVYDRSGFESVRDRAMAQPWWLDWTAGLFPVILVVFVLRSFVLEPFKIPSGSMIPTLRIGDFILVNKFHYGIRLPILDKKIIEVHQPARGDVMVFKYPLNPTMNYIKRVVGLPGDVVSYKNKKLTINGEPVNSVPVDDFYRQDEMTYTKQFSEQLGSVNHMILNYDYRPSFIPGANTLNYPSRDQCRYDSEGVTCTVPPGHYFMMGDNRDDSQDSRYWGFVPDENIVGKAFLVWMNFSDWKRAGTWFH